MNSHPISMVGLLRILDRLACPNCYSQLNLCDSSLQCIGCSRVYPIVQGVPDLRLSIPRAEDNIDDWSKHWSNESQQTGPQKFFSIYRKVVFSRTVAYFVNKHFPPEGVFIEAGSGTSETSLRIDKRGGKRTLVAVDIVLPVLQHTHPIMDENLCGDIFHLPFLNNTLDGVWNVGVMEHFTPYQIDQILGEFSRVLKNGAPLVMLWVGSNSIPQKVLRLLERFVNFRKPGEEFRFHPPEINLLKSPGEGRNILARNGFQTAQIDFGPRSLMAFITLVGKKTEDQI